MITDAITRRELIGYGILPPGDAPKKEKAAPYRRYGVTHLQRALALMRGAKDRAALRDRLRLAKFALGDAQDTSIQGDLITFLAFAISAIALYVTMSPDVPLGIRDWVLVTVFAAAFLVLFTCVIVERFRNRKRRFYLAAVEILLETNF